jgi:hypothetical protein
MFSEEVENIVKEWCQVVRLDAVSCSLAFLNIIATTLQFSWVLRSAGNDDRVPLNIHMMILARSCMYPFFTILVIESLF